MENGNMKTTMDATGHLMRQQKSEVPLSANMTGILLLIVDIVVSHLKVLWTLLEAGVKAFLPPKTEPVHGKVVLITGAGHGIGKELALKYGCLGAKVICWDINEKTNLQTVDEIKAAGGKAFAYVCNIRIRESINHLAAEMQREHGFVNIVINNAGIMPAHPLLQTTPSEINAMFEINVLAQLWIIQAFLPAMLERNSGHFVALSSCAGLFGLPNLVAYCGTKYAVRGVMDALREELRHIKPKNNIKFTTIYPYMVNTGLCKRPRIRFTKLMRLLSPTDVAASIVDAQMASVENVSLPNYFMYMAAILSLLPQKAKNILSDFMDAGVASDL